MCAVRGLGAVHLAYKTNCPCVAQLHSLARQALADGGVAPLNALAHKLVHAWRIEHEGVPVDEEAAHLGWNRPRGTSPRCGRWPTPTTLRRGCRHHSGGGSGSNTGVSLEQLVT